jgi:hypothetical protein
MSFVAGLLADLMTDTLLMENYHTRVLWYLINKSCIFDEGCSASLFRDC